jgi:peroxiredoxin
MTTYRTLLVLCSAVCALFAATTHAAVSNGAAAPDFTLKAADGSDVTLSALRGSWVVLEWVNPGCPFVVKFYNVGAMQKFQQQAIAMGARWLVINSTTPSHQDYMDNAKTRAYIADKNVQIPWLDDSAGTVGKAYDARTTPHMFIINPEGVVVYQGAIDSIRSANAADIDKAENYVMTALAAAMKGEPIANEQTRPYGCSVKY